jgi:hypothetical protein
MKVVNLQTDDPILRDERSKAALHIPLQQYNKMEQNQYSRNVYFFKNSGKQIFEINLLYLFIFGLQ